MGKFFSLLVVSLIILAGCAGNREAARDTGDYVEIDNPALTMSPGAPPTIWVPRSYVEKGLPRGGEVIERGVSSLKGSLAGSGDQQTARQAETAGQTAAVQPAPVVQPQPVPQPAPVVRAPQPAAPVREVAVPRPKHRIFVMEAGRGNLQTRFGEELGKAAAGNLVGAEKAALVARYAAVGTPSERSGLSRKLQEDFAATIVVFIEAPDGVGPGKTLIAEVYETNGGSLIRVLKATVPQYAAADAAARDAALLKALRGLAAETGDVIALVPWYGRVIAVDGDRVYVNAGKESGLGLGMVLNLYRSGKVIEKLGYAPGQKVAIVEIRGFVGTDGSFAAVREGGKAQVTDLVSFE